MQRKPLAVALIAAGMPAWPATIFGQQDANPYADVEHVQAGKKLYVKGAGGAK